MPVGRRAPDAQAKETIVPDLSQLHDAIVDGHHKAAEDITRQALAEGCDPLGVIQQYMMPAMAEVGRRFECDEYYVPELLLSARAMKAALALIRPLLAGADRAAVGRVAIGTVKGDLHDIGKNLVHSMLEGGGYDVIDLGVDVTPEQFVAAVRDKDANIVAMSALLTTTMPAMRQTIDALKAAGVRDRVRVIVGGAPITQAFAKEIGADAFSESAAGAVAAVAGASAARP
jgi:5-methyltetrahydrofolate--homocysteine methyltransferase